jgi:hypothetical protein
LAPQFFVERSAPVANSIYRQSPSIRFRNSAPKVNATSIPQNAAAESLEIRKMKHNASEPAADAEFGVLNIADDFIAQAGQIDCQPPPIFEPQFGIPQFGPQYR